MKHDDLSIKHFVESEGYRLITFQRDRHRNLLLNCGKGHEDFTVRWMRFKNGGRCRKCKGMARRTPDSTIGNTLKQRGYTAISISRIDYQCSVTYTCPKGHRRTSEWQYMKRGGGCQLCSALIRNRSLFKLPEETILDMVKGRGDTLIRVGSREVASSIGTVHYLTRVYLKCPKGHEYNADWGNYQAGKGCSFCRGDRISESKKTSQSDIEAVAEARGYTLISLGEALRGVPIGHRREERRVLLKCPQGHFWETQVSSFINGKYECFVCSRIQHGKTQRYSHEKAFTELRCRGFHPLRIFWKNTRGYQHEAIVRFKCQKGHTSEISLNHFRSGRGCTICGREQGWKRIADTKRFFEQRLLSPNFNLVSSLKRFIGRERTAPIDSS